MVFEEVFIFDRDFFEFWFSHTETFERNKNGIFLLKLEKANNGKS